MTHSCLYPLVLTKGDDLLEITRDPAGGADFVGFQNGRPVARGSETALVLRALVSCG